MPDNTKSNWFAFLCGDLSVTLLQFIAGSWVEIGQFGLKVLVTIILGAAGGIAGMIGKDIYRWYKAKRKNNKTQ